MNTATDTQSVKRYTTGPLPLSDAKTRADRVEALLAQHQRDGGRDMTVREMCVAFDSMGWLNKSTGRPLVLFPNHAEAAFAALEAAERVQCDRENKRACRVTGVHVKVYRLQVKQVELI